jgi:hypothetical protein
MNKASGGPHPSAHSGAREAIALLASIVAPVTVIGALLFYFGWSRSNAQASYFGIDSDVLGRSNQQYALRSIGSIFWPLVFILVGILIGMFTHDRARNWAADERESRLTPTGATIGAAGVALLILAGTAVRWRPLVGTGLVLTPTLFALGVALTAYGAFLVANRRADGLPPLPRSALALVLGVIAVFVFWAVGDYAAEHGRDLAKQMASNLWQRPSVTIYSPQRLYLEGQGITERHLGGTDSAYRYRYLGLKLLARAGDHYFLLPRCWTHEGGVTIVLPASDALRFDLAPGRQDLVDCAAAQ